MHIAHKLVHTIAVMTLILTPVITACNHRRQKASPVITAWTRVYTSCDHSQLVQCAPRFIVRMVPMP